MAEEIHDFTENEADKQKSVKIVKLILSCNTLPEFILVVRMEQIERNHKPKEEPVISHLPNKHIKRLRGFAEKMNKDTLIKSFEEMDENHFKAIKLSIGPSLYLDALLIQTELVDIY